MKVIGLTGGIASGKSTVSAMLRELGAAIIDVDQVGREVVNVGEAAYNKIIESFGRDTLLEDGSINRKKLGGIVFSDNEKLELLNRITHPEIIKKVIKAIEKFEAENKKIVVVDAAILIEMGLNKYVDSVWIVYADNETQIERLMKRDNLSYTDALDRINSQITNEQRMKYADIVIDNTQSVDAVRDRVKELWYKL